jgi:hypothetical protein
MNRKPASGKTFHHATHCTNCIFPKDAVLARHAYGLPLERFFMFWAYICNFSKNSILAYSKFYLLIYYTVKKTWNQEANLEIVKYTKT